MFLTETPKIHVVLCPGYSEIKLFQMFSSINKFISARGNSLKLFQYYFTGLLQLMNIFQRVYCRWNNLEIILELL